MENLVLLIAMMTFIPIFFFASEYAQIALHDSASGAGIFLLYFFIGFVIAAQIGGRILDREGAKRAVVLGCAIAAVGFGLWASKATTLSFSKQQIWIIVAGFGMGMMLGPANTDAVNRAGNLSYGEATGITQTIRNYGASLGLAALGTVLLFSYRSRLTTTLQAQHVPNAAARANTIMRSHRLPGGSRSARVRFRTSSPSTSPMRPSRCSTSCAGSWRSPQSSRSSGCSGGARKWCRSTTAPSLRLPRPNEFAGAPGTPNAALACQVAVTSHRVAPSKSGRSLWRRQACQTGAVSDSSWQRWWASARLPLAAAR
jgi:hypothetical protein